ncbi:HNH endonuclease [Acinetobacter baumannii]|nr:HNH endonuclease [Acinetobacter baumannii]
MVSPIPYTNEQLKFIKENCRLTRKELTNQVNEVFKTNYTVDQISGLCKRNKWLTGRTGFFEKGSVPPNKGKKGLAGANKTSFTKGLTPWNTKPIGYEYKDKKQGYIHIKVAEPNVFKLKHRVEWEKEKGPVPKGHVIAFKNFDRSDCRIENLMLMTRSEMARYNQLYLNQAKGETNESYLILAKVKAKTHQLMKV